MEVRDQKSSQTVPSLNDRVHKEATDGYERGLLKAFKNVKPVTPEIKHKPFYSHPGSYPEP